MGLKNRSFTYSGNPVTWRDAKREAKKEGKTFSEVVDDLLRKYVKARTSASIKRQHENIIGQDPHNPL